MPPHVTLTGVSSNDLLAWLPECIALVREELALHPLRPQPSAMLPYRPPLHHLYLFARRLARWYVGVYEVLPEAAPPFGMPLMLLAGELCDTPAAPGEVHVGIWRNVHFPLEIPEIAWLLEDRFPSKPAAASPLAPYTRPADIRPPAPPTMGTEAPKDPLVPGKPESTAASNRHGPAGAPPLACNIWLEGQITALADPYDFTHLFAEWLRQYIALRPEPPADPRRSFRRAAEAILKRRYRR